MNNIQNYGMTNYQTNFKARSAKKPIKTLADVVKKQKPLSQEEQQYNHIFNLLKRMKVQCNCNRDNDFFSNQGYDSLAELHLFEDLRF